MKIKRLKRTMALLSAVLMLTPIAVTTGASENNDFPAMGMENIRDRLSAHRLSQRMLLIRKA